MKSGHCSGLAGISLLMLQAAYNALDHGLQNLDPFRDIYDLIFSFFNYLEIYEELMNGKIYAELFRTEIFLS